MAGFSATHQEGRSGYFLPGCSSRELIPSTSASSLLPRVPSWPAANAEAVLRTYKKVPKTTPLHLLDRIEEADSIALKVVLEALREDERAIEADLDGVLSWLCPLLLSVQEEALRQPGARTCPLPFNDDGLPIAFFPPGTSSKTYCQLGLRAWTRALLYYDPGARQLAAWGWQKRRLRTQFIVQVPRRPGSLSCRPGSRPSSSIHAVLEDDLSTVLSCPTHPLRRLQATRR